MTSWLFVISPISSFFWPMFIIPALVASSLAQGSMFLFYDNSICRKTIWFPPGTDSLPQMADCSLGVTGYCCIASVIIFLSVLLLVCLKAPKRREFEPNYGLDVENGGSAQLRKGRNIIKLQQSSSFDSSSDQVYCNFPATPPMLGGHDVYMNNNEDDTSSSWNNTDCGYDTQDQDNDDLFSLSQYHQSTVERYAVHDDEIYNDPQVLPATDATIVRNPSDGNQRFVSRSRIETIQRIEKNTIDESNDTKEMIDQLLSELDKSFHVDEEYR